MSKVKGTLTDQQVETIIGNLLRGGVILAAVVVFIGGVFFLFHHGLLEDALLSRSRGVIQLGLLLLIATPIARVAFSIFAFFRQRDRTYVAVTLLVFIILLYSLLGRRA
jgi:uncharacterized membrane protein